MQQIMAHCFLAVKAKLECKQGYFDLIGCDFLIDENFKVLLRLSRGWAWQAGAGGRGPLCTPDHSGRPLGWAVRCPP